MCNPASTLGGLSGVGVSAPPGVRHLFTLRPFMPNNAHQLADLAHMLAKSPRSIDIMTALFCAWLVTLSGIVALLAV